jgi:hypothetical protein
MNAWMNITFCRSATCPPCPPSNPWNEFETSKARFFTVVMEVSATTYTVHTIEITILRLKDYCA